MKIRLRIGGEGRRDVENIEDKRRRERRSG
jgi:hypothetical protein